MKKNTPDKRLEDIWEQVPVDYYQSGIRANFFQRLWHSRKISNCKKILRRVNFKNCLDVGCASGYMLSEIAKSFPKAKYSGVDVYKKAIDYGKKKYPNLNLIVASADNS